MAHHLHISGHCAAFTSPSLLALGSLRLAADMKLPGRGWLEFEVTPRDGGTRAEIRQTATFDPRGLLGRAYWYAVLPLHALVFRGMLRGIARRATLGGRGTVAA